MKTQTISVSYNPLYANIQNSSNIYETQLFKNHNFDGTDTLSGIKVQLPSGGYVAKEDTYRAKNAQQKDFLNKVTDELTDGFKLSSEIKSDLIAASVQNAMMRKHPSGSDCDITLNEIIVEMKKILEANDNDNAKPPVTHYDNTYKNSTRDVSLRDKISNAKCDDDCYLFKNMDFTYTNNDKENISNLFDCGMDSQYIPQYDDMIIYKSLDILTSGFTLSDDIKNQILAEAISLGDPTNTTTLTIQDVIDNIAKVLERYDSNLESVKNKGDVVHDDTAVMWKKNSTIEKQAGVKTVDDLFKQFNPDKNGNIKLSDARTYFKNLLDDMDATQFSYVQLESILKAGSITGTTTLSAFKNAISFIESQSKINISSSIQTPTPTPVTLQLATDGKITGTLPQNEQVDTALGLTLETIFDKLDADDDGVILASKAKNFIIDSLKLAGITDTAFVNALVDRKSQNPTGTNQESVTMAELSAIMKQAERLSRKNLFDIVDGLSLR